MTIAEKLIRNKNDLDVISSEVDSQADLIAQLQDMADNLPDASGSDEDNMLYYASNIWQTYKDVVFPENYALTIHLAKPGTIYHAFMNATNLKSIKIITDDTESTFNLMQAFREATSVEVIDLSECSREVASADYMLFQANNLKKVIGALDMSNCTSLNYTFFASVLEEIEIVPGTIKVNARFNSAKLTQKSIESIIDGLADLTGSDAQTITLNGVGRSLTEAQQARIAAKNWLIAY